MEHDTQTAWIEAVRARGWATWLSTALDVLEPLGPLGAQILWTAQPALGLFIDRAALAALAATLEEPGGVERLRAELERDD